MLTQILSNKQHEIECHKHDTPPSKVRKLASKQTPAVNFADALRGDKIRLIAEIKKTSPSRGIICHDFNPLRIARIYADSGAAAISVLTDSRYFQGSLEYLADIRKSLGENHPPLLRKDFLIDPYQIYQSRASGADAVLLIVAILTITKLREMLTLSNDLGMHCLVEVHNEAEVEIALKSNAKVIGINNRDLHTFSVDLTTTERLRPLIPHDRIVVSESGIRSHQDIVKLRQLKVDAVLIGESLVLAPDIATRIKELIA